MIEESFKDSVDEYLDFCKDVDKIPEIPKNCPILLQKNIICNDAKSSEDIFLRKIVGYDNEDNITVIDYTISNIDEIKEAIKNAINTQEEVEIKFTIKFSNGGIGTKTVNPCILTIITTVLGDSYENSYIRYIEDDNTLKTNSKWIDGVNNRLLQEALQNKKGSDESNKTFVIKK